MSNPGNVGGDYIAGNEINQSGGGNTVRIGSNHQHSGSADDFSAMMKFVEAADHNISLMGLTDEQQLTARKAIEDIRTGRASGHNRSILRNIAISLRHILEEAAGNAFASVVLSQWSPR